MPVQTTYEMFHEAGNEGQRVDLGLVNIISKSAEGSDIDFGRAVVRGTADGQAILPSGAPANDNQFMGITEETTAWANNGEDIHLYEENREMNIIDFGMIYGYTETSVVPGDPVYFRHTAQTAPLDIVGRFRNDDSTANAYQIPGATFESTGAAGDIVRIKLTNQR